MLLSSGGIARNFVKYGHPQLLRIYWILGMSKVHFSPQKYHVKANLCLHFSLLSSDELKLVGYYLYAVKRCFYFLLMLEVLGASILERQWSN